uniref:Superoxide dismutase [Mn], mitochondrial n=1 Tax=Bos indicus x Bos taurus TaxID=30522 RepID=A0A4W2HXC5_BOBOX
MYVNSAAQSLARGGCTVTLLSGLAEVPRSVHSERTLTQGSSWRGTGPTPSQSQGPLSCETASAHGCAPMRLPETLVFPLCEGPGTPRLPPTPPRQRPGRSRNAAAGFPARPAGPGPPIRGPRQAVPSRGRNAEPYHLFRGLGGGKTAALPLATRPETRSRSGGPAARAAAGETAGPLSHLRWARSTGGADHSAEHPISPALEAARAAGRGRGQRGAATRAPRGPRAGSTMLSRAACSTSRRLVPALSVLGSRQKHSLPDLPYDYGALEPHINAQIMQLHHSKHHAAYVNNLNVAEEKYREALEKRDVTAQIALQPALKFNGGGHINHSIFWTNLSPNGGGEPQGELLEAIKRDFGSFAKFKEKLTAVSVGVQGSGWGWLGFNKEQGRLQIAACSNQDPLQGTTGLIPLLGIDVWEHAYYLQYKNVRPDYLKAIWNVINWENVTARYTACSK